MKIKSCPRIKSTVNILYILKHMWRNILRRPSVTKYYLNNNNNLKIDDDNDGEDDEDEED